MLEKLLKENTDSTFVQMFRYSFTGTVAIIADYYCLFLLTENFKMYYLLSVAIAYLVGIIVNYHLSSKWVFKNKTSAFDNILIELGIFTLIGLLGLGFLEILMHFFTEFYNYHYLVSKTLATMLVSMWNFFARKHFLFS